MNCCDHSNLWILFETISIDAHNVVLERSTSLLQQHSRKGLQLKNISTIYLVTSIYWMLFIRRAEGIHMRVTTFLISTLAVIRIFIFFAPSQDTLQDFFFYIVKKEKEKDQ
jgi:hypothetical protein